MKTVLRSTSALGFGFACALAVSTATALADPLWVRRYPDPDPGHGVDRATAVAVDAAGNVAVTGFSDNATDDPNNYEFNCGYPYYCATGTADYYTAKYAGNGSLLWDKRYNGTGQGDDVATDVKMDGAGNVIVTGYSLNRIGWSGGSTHDFYTAKYAASNGARLWEHRGPDFDNRSVKMVLDPTGHVIVTGKPTGPPNFGGYYTAKYDAADGHRWWEATYTGANNNNTCTWGAPAVDSAGNVLVTGTATIDLGIEDIYTEKYAAEDGHLMWAQRYHKPGSSSGNHGTAVAVDNQDNVVVNGYYFIGNTIFYYTAKYTSAGELLWEQEYDHNGANGSWGVMALDSDGNVLVSAFTSGGSFVIKYPAAGGGPSWVQPFIDSCTPGADEPRAIAANHSGDVIVGGLSYAGDTVGYGHYRTVMYAAVGGQVLWQENYIGPGNLNQRRDEFAALAIDGTGNVIVTGFSQSASGDYDYATVKYRPSGGTPSTINCPPNLVVSTSPGQCSAVVNYTAPTATDECGNPLAATCSPPSGSVFPKGTTSVVCTAADDSTCGFTVTVENPSPTATITGPPSGAVYAVGTAVTFTGSFTDNAGDTHSAQWLVDSSSFAGTVNEANGQVSATVSFSSPGVYLVKLAVTDNCGNTATTDTVGGLPAMVVIYDPTGGYVTGGGWFNSPDGAYTSQPTLTGKASFGFVSRYQKGATVPTGETEFQFQVANFNFHSTSYEWLVISGARAQYKGSGTVNNAGSYGFILTAIDGAVRGGGGADKFRIKIWDKSSGGIVYDNQLGALDSADPSTVISGGSVVVHAQ